MTVLDVLFDFFRRAAGPRRGHRHSNRPAKTGKPHAHAQPGERGAEAIYRVEGVSDLARKVYAYLSASADADGCCPAFHRAIAKGTGISRPSVAKAIKELESRGLITHRHRIGRRGEDANLYQVNPVSQR